MTENPPLAVEPGGTEPFRPPLQIDLDPPLTHRVLIAADVCGQSPSEFALEAIALRTESLLRQCWFCTANPAVLTLTHEKGSLSACEAHLPRLVQAQEKIAGRIGIWSRLATTVHGEASTSDLAMHYRAHATQARLAGDLDRADSYTHLAGRLDP